MTPPKRRIPNIWDWIRNPRKAAGDSDAFGVAIEMITQPLIVYERETADIRSAKIQKKGSGALFVLSALLAASSYIKSPTDYDPAAFKKTPTDQIVTKLEPLVTPFFSLAHFYISRRKIRTKAATRYIVRQLHPQKDKPFGVIDAAFGVTTAIHPKDIFFANDRLRNIKTYAKDLDLS